MNMTQDELEYKIRRLENELERANDRIIELEDELYSANFKIQQELAPRIALEKRGYDNYITNGER